MIYTLTTNPAVDMNVASLKQAKYSKINRTVNAKYTANGKGINVSNTLRHFGIDSTVLGFFGGFTGKFIVEDVENKGFKIKPIMVDDNTRINVFLNDGEGEFNFVNEGSYVNNKAQDKMLDVIEAANDMEILSISGSLAKGIEDNFYDKVLSICNNKGIKIVLDISSKKFSELLKYKPYIIKPNNEEIESIFDWNLNSEQDIVNALVDLYKKGAQNILLTCGDDGMYFYNGKNFYYSYMEPVDVVSTACAGDAALAAFMSIFVNDQEKIVDALKFACATGANVAESKGLGTFGKVEHYVNLVSVKKLDNPKPKK